MTASKSCRELFFIQGLAGRLCAVYYHPAGNRRAGRDILHVPAFAEEMNKSRRMVALQADTLARSGVGVLVVDLYGTGDSEGDFSQARWDIWLGDLAVAAQWLRKHGSQRLTLWGLRLGCLLATEYACRDAENIDTLIYWQPVTHGRIMLTQFLRLRVAAGMMNATGVDTVDALREKLEDGDSIEIAGYEIAPALAHAIEERIITDLIPPHGIRIHWLELIPSAARQISANSRNIIGELINDKVSICTHSVIGAPFWATQEITVVPSLLEETITIFHPDNGRDA